MASTTTKKASQILEQRNQGRHLVFTHIRNNEQAARIDIANATGLSPATVTAITAELISEGLIEETQRTSDQGQSRDQSQSKPQGQSRRGRPRVDLKLRGQAHLVAGLKLAAKHTTAVILDLEGRQLGEAQMPTPSLTVSATQATEMVRSLTEQAATSAGLSLQDLSAVGVGLPGLIKAETGFVDWSPMLEEQQVNLQAMFNAALPVPVFIENDANLVAIAELWFGFGRDEPDFLVVTIEQGVGLGIVLDGKIYRGTQGFGAEFGHMKVQLEGALCRCGQRGCLEAYISDYALLREADLFSHWNTETPDESRLARLYDNAKKGDHTAQSIFDRASRMFAMGLANLINLFDPSLVILSGEQMRFDYLYAQTVFDAVKKSTIQKGHHAPEIRIHKWGDHMWAKGAAAYALEEIVRHSIDMLKSNDTAPSS